MAEDEPYRSGSAHVTGGGRVNAKGFKSRDGRWLFAPDGERLGVVLPDGPVVGLFGLGDAVARLHEAIAGVGRGRGGAPVAAALGEALLWVGALDDHFQHDDPRWATPDDYFAQREVDASGRTVGGLMYVRNLQVHGLHTAALARESAGQLRVTVGDRVIAEGDGQPLFSIRHVWAPWVSLPRPRQPERHDRHALYEAHVEGRPLTAPLDVAHEWFRAFAADP